MNKGSLALLCLLFLASIVYGQTIKGKITNNLGKGLQGISVMETGSENGAFTDDQGIFSINVKNPQGKLTFSGMGFKTTTVPINGQSVIDVSLEQDFGDLEGVVVVGYGTQKRGNLSGAVTQVDAKTLQDRPIANVSQGLQGVVPNLNIQFGSGAPGAAADINIRGITSINGGSPLVLVDGVPIAVTDLNRIATQDVASISVIKDASAAAIYGARASFGVILITTKVGKGKPVTVNYSNSFNLNRQTVVPDKITDPYIFSRLLELSTDNTPWDNVNYSDQFYKYAKERSDDPSIPGVRVDPTNPDMWEYMGNQDWTRYFMKDNFFTQNHDLSISGVSDNKRADYYLSGGFSNQKSPLTLAKDDFEKYTLRSKINYKVTDWLKIGNNTFISNTSRTNPLNFDLFSTYNIFPTSFDKNPDGTWANSAAGRLAASVVDGGQVSNKVFDVMSTFNTELSLVKNVFKINADFTTQKSSQNYKSYRTKYKIGYGPNDVREEGNTYAYQYAGFGYYNLFNIYGTLNKTFGKHSPSLIAGYSAEDYRFESFEANKNNLISSSYPTLALATGTATATSGINTYSIIGTFFRLNYIFDNKYIVEFNGRYDGSSRFPRDKRYGFFPSASVAWRLDKENFIKNIDAINELKLRFSYGELGNQNVSNYGYIPSMNMYQSSYLFNGQRPNAIAAPGLVSDNYTWEKVNTTNLGLDFGFFRNKISGSFDIYRRNTIGMLTFGKDLPGILGAAEPRENAADLKTTGWELSLAYNNQFKVASSPLSLNVRFVLSDTRSWITKFDNPRNSILQYYEGMELGEIWGLTNDGLFKDEAQIAALDETAIIPWGALQIVPGWPKYMDLDKNGKIEKGYTLDDTRDLSRIGNSNPRYRYGMDLNMAWKGFDLRVFFQGVARRDYYPIDYLYWGHYQQPYGGTYGHLLDFYRPTADSEVDMAKHSQSYIAAGLANQNLDANYPILQSWLADRNLGTRIDESMGLAIPQTKYMLNGAYLRIKNLTLGYTLPKELVSRFNITNLRLFFSAENLTEWSEVKKYFDPESINLNIYSNPTQSPSRSGNGMVYPFQRTYSAGLNLTF